MIYTKDQFLDINGLTEFVKYLKTYINNFDEILYYASFTLFPESGKEDVVYIDTSTGTFYRWNVSSKEYVALSQNVKYAASAGNALMSTNVSGSLTTTDGNRHIWFSDFDTETKRSYDDKLKYNPSSNTITTNISGTASIANTVPWLGISGKPTSYPPNEHTHPYISELSISGTTITYTKGDGTIGTIGTQDTNTWRGIQNNLTSESSVDSLSAAQGKILNDTKIGAVKANDYYGIAMPDGTSTGWIRTTSTGLLPYESGAVGNGHSSLGNESWYFSKAYIDNIYGNLQGNAKTASKLSTARKIGNASFDGSSDITLAQMGINNPIEITKADYEDLKKNNKIDMSAYYNIIDDYDSIDIINDEYVSTNQVFSSSKIDSVYSKKSIIHSITLEVQNWVKKNDKYQYVLSVNGITENNIIEINYSPVATADEINAYQKASLRDGGQSKGQGILVADILPAINIPITVIIRNDL